jgi:hypothetical protein
LMKRFRRSGRMLSLKSILRAVMNLPQVKIGY